MYILIHKIYLEENIHKIIIFIKTIDRLIQLDLTDQLVEAGYCSLTMLRF